MKFAIPLRSRAGIAALEELDPQSPEQQPPLEGAPAEGSATATDADGGAAAPADGAPADAGAPETPPTDGGDGSGTEVPPVEGDTGTPAGDVPAGGTDLTADTTPVEGNEVPPPAEGAGDNGNAQVDSLPEPPTIDGAAPADAGVAATPAGDVPASTDGEADPSVDAVTPSTDEAAIGEEIKANVSEMDEIQVATDDVRSDTEQLEVAVEHLQDIVNNCRASLERGGFDRFATSNAKGRLALICSSLDTKMPNIAGLESAGDDVNERINQTGNLEASTANLLSRVRAQITKGAEDMKQWAKNVYAIMTDASLRVEKRAGALKAKAATTGQAVQVTDQVVIAGVTLGDAIPTDMTRAVGELVKTLQFLNASASYAKLEEAMDIVQAMINDPSKKSSLDARFAAAVAGYSNKMIGATAGVLVGGSNGTSKSKLFAEKELVTMIPTEASRLGEAKSSLVEAKAANVPQSINGLDSQVAVRVCDAVIAAARQLREFNKSGAMQRLNERLASVLRSAQSMESSEGTSPEVAQAVVAMAKSLVSAVANAPVYAYNRSMIPSLNAVLDFVAASAGAPAPADAGAAGATPPAAV